MKPRCLALEAKQQPEAEVFGCCLDQLAPVPQTDHESGDECLYDSQLQAHRRLPGSIVNGMGHAANGALFCMAPVISASPQFRRTRARASNSPFMYNSIPNTNKTPRLIFGPVSIRHRALTMNRREASDQTDQIGSFANHDLLPFQAMHICGIPLPILQLYAFRPNVGAETRSLRMFVGTSFSSLLWKSTSATGPVDSAVCPDMCDS